ncbi:YALI0B15532p [Yarrowia lipolytica CLIB122]|uniref:YALI0B15532p n=2 Tax=Yarrowia lipolytica TaxID=4952 RepID=Q6CEH7_YARLI|nr:YALI0B15532p [Yarrowia lipolytica CLIB122]AOW01750.1 hypothetical protein YALI1_B20399g [Yarrowia lipolytica]CAG83186.1 YALI0B15532p [Yarrowia lipolytica CLIB122]|eukprot:XP_500935.1 YALI0B15532p [Yarrowia lipolytica CLIB122]
MAPSGATPLPTASPWLMSWSSSTTLRAILIFLDPAPMPSNLCSQTGSCLLTSKGAAHSQGSGKWEYSSPNDDMSDVALQFNQN